MPPNSTFCIKPGYIIRSDPIYFADEQYADSDIVHQPDAYKLAAFLARRYEADTIIDIGCGRARKLMELTALRKVGVDFLSNLQHCRQSFPAETWIEADLENAQDLDIDGQVVKRSIIICADVIEHLVDPTNLLMLLQRLAHFACAVIITTPERDLVRGTDDIGPPANPAHAREWSLSEFKSLLQERDLSPAFVGLTINNSKNQEKKTILSIIDQSSSRRDLSTPDEFSPLAIIATYNDRDVILTTTRKLLHDRIAVHVLDNWSDDGTFEALTMLSTELDDLSIQRFPEAGPSEYYEWHALLKEKEAIARRHPGRWIIHQDSDEVRLSPWPGRSFREGLYVAERLGYSAVDFTVCNFRPVNESFKQDFDPEIVFRHFEFGRMPGHFVQIKAWHQKESSMSLAESGEHQVQFSGRRVFPYKFMLKHYPLRTPEQARRKIFVERLGRYSPQERAAGWHIHYDNLRNDDSFLWSADDLIEWDEQEIRQKFLVELISGIGIVR
jgi:hypothetical protein